MLFRSVSKTLYYEARGEGERGIRAVASTIYNRSARNGGVVNCDSYIKQSLRHKQYSCWNGSNGILPSGSGYSWEICRKVAYEMITGKFKPTNSYTHYYAHKKVTPYWSQGVKKTIIGNHTFLTTK